MNIITSNPNTHNLKQVREKAAAYGVKALTDAECLRFLGLSTLNESHIEAMTRIIKSQKDHIRTPIESSRDVYNIVQDWFVGVEYESLLLICLNSSNKVIAIKEISNGSATGTVADPKKIFKLALETKFCCQIILAHNHPSGQCKPSQADITLTRKIRESGKMLEVNLLDHIIYCDHQYYSFADEGMLV